MSELEAQMENRREKRAALEGRGVTVFPHEFEHDFEPSGVHSRFGELDAEQLESKPVELRVPGRVRAIRKHGKTSFVDLHDGEAKLQVMIRRKAISEDDGFVLDHLDLGDYLGVTGRLIRTRTGELTLQAAGLAILAKAVRPLPEKWHGLSDIEARYRQRYLDLIVNPESRRVFEIRTAIIQGIRRYLDELGFLEVETPMMHVLPGGAAARPFVTHHNALDLDLYLRIAPELYLKRLVVGGLHRVYEINRNFRNEGISTQHNPEFTMLEFYWAYANFQTLMEHTEAMIVGLAEQILGRDWAQWQGERLDLSRPWRRYTMREALTELAGIEGSRLEHVADLASIFQERGLPLPRVAREVQHPVLEAGSREAFESAGDEAEVPEDWYGNFLMELFEATVEDQLVQPTFITEYPVSVSPLAKQCPEDPRFTERFELYMGGMEIANAFSELNDPDVQAERFRQQTRSRAGGDDEAHRFDHDYVRALEHGMPPAGGEGVGIDRLTMLFTDRASIRDVILFPLLRPQDGNG